MVYLQGLGEARETIRLEKSGHVLGWRWCFGGTRNIYRDDSVGPGALPCKAGEIVAVRAVHAVVQRDPAHAFGQEKGVRYVRVVLAEPTERLAERKGFACWHLEVPSSLKDLRGEIHAVREVVQELVWTGTEVARDHEGIA